MGKRYQVYSYGPGTPAPDQRDHGRHADRAHAEEICRRQVTVHGRVSAHVLRFGHDRPGLVYRYDLDEVPQADAPAAQANGPTTEAIDARRIVLGVIEQNPQAAHAYLHEAQMHYGVEVVIGTLGRAAEVLMTSGGHTRGEAEDMIREIAVACSDSGGAEDERAIALAAGDLFPPGGPLAAHLGDPMTDATGTGDR